MKQYLLIGNQWHGNHYEHRDEWEVHQLLEEWSLYNLSLYNFDGEFEKVVKYFNDRVNEARETYLKESEVSGDYLFSKQTHAHRGLKSNHFGGPSFEGLSYGRKVVRFDKLRFQEKHGDSETSPQIRLWGTRKPDEDELLVLNTKLEERANADTTRVRAEYERLKKLLGET